MFEEEDDNDDFFDDDELTEMEEWYDDNYEYFKRESNPETSIFIDVPLDVELFYNTVYCPAMREIATGVRRLVYKQYPLIKTESRPIILEYIDWAIEESGKYLLLNLYELIQDQREGINLREKYPEFESWVDFYGRPPAPPVLDYSFMDYNPVLKATMSEDVIKEVAEESLKGNTEYYEVTENQKKEYFNVVQPIVLKYYKALEELDYEGWIIYAVNIREDYEIYKDRLDHVETVIEYGLDEEDIDLEYDKFMEKLKIKFDEKWEREHKSKDTK